MAAVERLVTFVELVDDAPRRYSMSARHEAVLTDGSRVLLLDDRGWTSGLHSYGDGDEELPDIWSSLSAEGMEGDARMVVGPDGTVDEHWAYLAGILERQGVSTDPGELKSAPHDVVLGERVLARLSR